MLGRRGDFEGVAGVSVGVSEKLCTVSCGCCCCDRSVKPAVFDLFLGIAIAAYLAFIYFIVQVCSVYLDNLY